MRPPSWTITALAVLSLSLAACGSVANKTGTGGTSGSGGSGTGGGSGDTGGSTGAGGAAAGGATGSMGGAGGAQTDGGPSDGGGSGGANMVARGAITPFALFVPVTGATIHVTHQRFGPTFACNANTCFSGGLLRQ